MVTFFDPGLMTARLELEAPQQLPDGQGGAMILWQPLAAVWARIEPVSFQVAEQAQASLGTISHRIWIRHRAGVEAGLRLRRQARIFAIRLVRDPDETGRYLVCQCEEQSR